MSSRSNTTSGGAAELTAEHLHTVCAPQGKATFLPPLVPAAGFLPEGSCPLTAAQCLRPRHPSPALMGAAHHADHAVSALLREVYRVTESLQREKSGLLKQLDFLRCVWGRIPEASGQRPV